MSATQVGVESLEDTSGLCLCHVQWCLLCKLHGPEAGVRNHAGGEQHGLGAPEVDPLAFKEITVMGAALGQISLRNSVARSQKKFPASTYKKFGQFRKKFGQFPKTSISHCLVQLQCLLKIKINFVLVYIIRGYHS